MILGIWWPFLSYPPYQSRSIRHYSNYFGIKIKKYFINSIEIPAAIDINICPGFAKSLISLKTSVITCGLIARNTISDCSIIFLLSFPILNPNCNAFSFKL